LEVLKELMETGRGGVSRGKRKATGKEDRFKAARAIMEAAAKTQKG